MTSIICHTGRPDTQGNVSYVLDVYVSTDVHFSNFEEQRNTFFKSLLFAPRVMY